LLIANNFATQSLIYYKLLYVNVWGYIMAQEINLKELEKKAFRPYHEDGIWDIFPGLIMMAIAGIAVGYIVFGIAAVIILGMGLVVLSRFLRDHPLPEMEVYDAGHN